MRITPVILCGGSGSRMWPLSRGEYPKQFINLHGDDSLLQQTINRLTGLSDITDPILICNNEQRFLLSEQLRQIDIHRAKMILEPCGRNTAPALASAALIAQEQDTEALLVVLPADHVVRNTDVFQQLILQAKPLAEQGYLVTFGVTPHQAHTGYGYIKRGVSLAASTAYHVAAFVEKPNFEQALELIAEQDHYWNSGMFMFKADVYLKELKRFNPEIFTHVSIAVKEAQRDLDFIRLEQTAFAQCPQKSIDYAVMEHTEQAALIVADNLGWSDIGSWDALSEVSPADEHGNNIIGDVHLHDVKNSYLRSENRMIAAVGLDNIVVIETADAILVAQKDKAQGVKNIVERLNLQGRPETLKHRRVYRPWGSYDSIDTGARFQVKRIIVNPGSSLSLQMHFHRAEHWIVVKGTARITNGDQILLLTENQSTYIPVGTMHRLENPGKFPLELIEIQSGGYLGEDDIVRFEDVYGRTTAE